MTQVIDCVGIICLRGDQVLLMQRGKEPRKGQWSIPGGRIEPGETEIEAAKRELFEETSISASNYTKLEIIEADFGKGPYRLHDYVAEWQSGEPVAGDDAADAKFVPIDAIDELGIWSETVRIIKKAYELSSAE